jgi:hypothetical protein
MKLVFTFFLFVCSHLVGGFNFAQASAYTGKTCSSPTQCIEKTQQIDSADTNREYTVTTDEGSVEVYQDLINIEDDDEEDNFRKQIASASQFLAFCYAFLSNPPSSYHSDRLPFSRHLSGIGSSKYIVQRVLRI